MIVWRWTMPSPIGPIGLAATDQGLCRIAFGAEDEATMQGWLDRRIGPARSIVDPAPFRWVVEHLAAYFAGEPVEIVGPLDLRGTTFQRAVWTAVRAIPFGQVWTYAAIARALGQPRAVRAVGAANAANPLPIVIPCHRLIGRDGSLRGYGGGLPIKAWLLRHEGVDLPKPSADLADHTT